MHRNSTTGLFSPEKCGWLEKSRDKANRGEGGSAELSRISGHTCVSKQKRGPQLITFLWESLFFQRPPPSVFFLLPKGGNSLGFQPRHNIALNPTAQPPRAQSAISLLNRKPNTVGTLEWALPESGQRHHTGETRLGPGEVSPT